MHYAFYKLPRHRVALRNTIYTAVRRHEEKESVADANDTGRPRCGRSMENIIHVRDSITDQP